MHYHLKYIKQNENCAESFKSAGEKDIAIWTCAKISKYSTFPIIRADEWNRYMIN
jgi:hypothetical protein